AGHDYVQARLHRRVEVGHHGRGRCAGAHDLVRAEDVAAELPDRQARPVDGDRWDDDVDTRAVLEARVTHRLRLVDPPSDRGDDAVDDAPQAALVLEGKARQLDLAAAFDEDLL